MDLLYKIAAVATIIAALIGVWRFMEHLGVGGGAIDNAQKEKESVGDTAINKVLKKEKESVELSVDLPVYKNERNWLFAMYQAALSLPYLLDKSDALKRVVKAVIESNDFNVASIAANKSAYLKTKDEMRDEVVMAAVKSKERDGSGWLDSFCPFISGA